MLSFLPQNVQDALKHINANYLYEIRLRVENPVFVNYAGKYRFLSLYGLTDSMEKAIICDMLDIEECVYQAGKCSIYSVEEQIKQGFITAEKGVRIGLAGEYVYDKGKPLAMRNFTSLCIRIPHEIVGCGQAIYECCMSDKVQSVLIASSPGQGKTTILRDLARILSEKTRKNLLICDERGEIAVKSVGVSCDVMKYADKAVAFEAGIRAMRPDIMITDELSISDFKALQRAKNAGIILLASAHLTKMQDVSREFLDLFDYFVFLDENEIGKIKGIYNGTGKKLW